FALVSLNWRRLPGRAHDAVIVLGFLTCAASLVALALLVRGGYTGGASTYLAAAAFGAGMAAAYSPMMTRVLMGVPVADAPDATGVIVTAVQLALVVGVATFGTLYLNLAGRLPAPGASGFRLPSAHAEAVTLLTLAAAAIAGAALSAARAL